MVLKTKLTEAAAKRAHGTSMRHFCPAAQALGIKLSPEC